MFNTLYKCETFYCFYKTMTLELFNIAMEYGPYVDMMYDDLPMTNDHFATLNNQRVL